MKVMTELQILELLDKVLFLVKDKESVLYSDLNKEVEVFDPKPEKGQLIIIILKLKKDGYINEDSARYQITIDGYVFAASGGYLALNTKGINEAILLQQEIDRRKLIDSKLEENSARLNKLTTWLAVGTIVLALLELIKLMFFLTDKFGLPLIAIKMS